MSVSKRDMLLYAITDRSWLGTKKLSNLLEEILPSGVTFLQLREKDLPNEELLIIAKEVREITRKYHIPFVINDNVEVAADSDADGVHLGQGDDHIAIAREKLGPDKIIGLSAHNVEEAILAEKLGADYIGVGAVFPTSTKTDAAEVSFITLKEICDAVHIPVVAIGGINKNNIMELSGSGVSGVAVISAIFAQEDPASATSELRRVTKKMIGE